MPNFKVYPYKQGSRSAKTLANALKGKVLKHVGSKYRPKAGDVVINWGASNLPEFAPATTLNRNVRVAQCKLATFNTLFQARVNIPKFWKGRQEMLEGENDPNNFPVVCRTKLNGHSGEGIVIAENAEQLVNAPLYTKYIKKKDEYRVHVYKENIFFVQRKARRMDVDNPNWKVRNLEGGFVYVQINFEECPDDVRNQAIAAIRALGLDFGGVDIIWNEKERKAYVLEVNTACGLEERTADLYAQAIR